MRNGFGQTDDAAQRFTHQYVEHFLIDGTRCLFSKLTCVFVAEVELQVLCIIKAGVWCGVPWGVKYFFLLQEIGEGFHHEMARWLAGDVQLGLRLVDKQQLLPPVARWRGNKNVLAKPNRGKRAQKRSQIVTIHTNTKLNVFYFYRA